MDYELQKRLEQQVLREYLACKGKPERLKIWERFVKLHASRPPGMVEQMELDRGIA